MGDSETRAGLVRLSDSTLELADSGEDIRGRAVVDRNAEEWGKISDLYVDETEQRVRLVEVATGGFLGVGQTKTLFPVDAVTSIREHEVSVDSTREHLTAAPAYDPDLVSEHEYLASLYEHYGRDPYFHPGYAPTRFPYL